MEVTRESIQRAFAKNLAKKLSEKKISQRALGQSIGVTASSICQYLHPEMVTKIPNLYTVKKIADTLGCTIDELINENV